MTSAHQSAVFCPEDNQFSITSACIWVAALVRGHVCASFTTCTCMWVPVCLCTASLYIYWNEQSSQGPLCRAQARSHASVYRLPGIKAWLSQPSPTATPERWPTRRQSSAGEDWVSSPGCRLGGQALPPETWKGEMLRYLCMCWGTQAECAIIYKALIRNPVTYDRYSGLYICLNYTTHALKQCSRKKKENIKKMPKTLGLIMI